MSAEYVPAFIVGFVAIAALVYVVATSGRRTRARQIACGGCGKGLEPEELACPFCGFVVAIGRRPTSAELAEARGSLRQAKHERAEVRKAVLVLVAGLIVAGVLLSSVGAAIVGFPLQTIAFCLVIWLVFGRKG